jgi:hypothetical protein
MTPLTLTGSAITVTGTVAKRPNRRILLRLRAPRSIAAPELDERDGALVRNQEDLEDVWCLVFDSGTKHLAVRHEWETSGHNGVDEFDIGEFLAQEGPPQTALIDELFRPVLVDT